MGEIDNPPAHISATLNVAYGMNPLAKGDRSERHEKHIHFQASQTLFEVANSALKLRSRCNDIDYSECIVPAGNHKRESSSTCYLRVMNPATQHFQKAIGCSRLTEIESHTCNATFSYLLRRSYTRSLQTSENNPVKKTISKSVKKSS